MNIKLSLTLRFLILVAILLASFSLVVYENYSRYRHDDYFERLRERSEAIAKHIIEITDPVLLNKILASENDIEPMSNLRVSVYSISGNLIGDSSTITNNGTISTVTFLNSSIETAPGSLPPTNVSQFSFYINGQYIEHSAITSFINSGSNTILTLNNVALGFGLDITMEVVASGKFSN
jgi:hypothetical protein